MEFVSVNDPDLLESLQSELHGSPEQLLEELEEALENGDISITDAIAYLQDIATRN